MPVHTLEAFIGNTPLVLIMPEHMSAERRAAMRAYGAEIVLVPEKDGKERNGEIQIVGVQRDGESSIPGIRKWPEAYIPKIFDPSRVDK